MLSTQLRSIKLIVLFILSNTSIYGQEIHFDYENEDSTTSILCNDFDSIGISKSFTSDSYDSVFNYHDYIFSMHGKYVDYYGVVYGMGASASGEGIVYTFSVDELGGNLNPNFVGEALIIADADVKFDFTNYSNPSKTVSFDIGCDLGQFTFLIDGMNYLSPPTGVFINTLSLSNGNHIEVSGTFNSIVIGGWEEVIDNMCVTDYIPSTTGINKTNSDFNVIIYPNPIDDRATINVTKLKENYSYQLLDLSGKQLTQGELNNPETTISFSNYAMGMYYIKILSSKNETLETFQVIKNK